MVTGVQRLVDYVTARLLSVLLWLLPAALGVLLMSAIVAVRVTPATPSLLGANLVDDVPVEEEEDEEEEEEEGEEEDAPDDDDEE